MARVVAINAGPRKGWNTDQLVDAAAQGTKEAGAEVDYIDLFKLEKYTGCVSCFACKREGSFGKCACRDGLFDVLEKIRQADALIIGSPVYLGQPTASFRALYERLVFQYLTYNKERPCCNEHLIPTLLILTSNCPEEAFDAVGMTPMIEGYKGLLSGFVGPTEIFACGDTLQVNDYSKYDWTVFNPAAKQAHHDATFGDYLARAKEAGAGLLAAE